MRLLILTATAALTLGACGSNDQSGNTTNVDESLTADNIVSNDVTAIDAVTADAANMAADVNYVVETNNVSENAAGNASERPTTPRPPRTPSTPPPPPLWNRRPTMR